MSHDTLPWMTVYVPSTNHTPHCWGLLGFLRSLPTIHSSHQSLQQMHWFEAFFKIFVCAVSKAIEVKGRSMLNFEAATSKFGNQFWNFGYQPQKSKADLCMTNSYKVLIFVFFIVPQRLTLLSNAKRKISKSNFGTIWHIEINLTFSRLAAKLSEISRSQPQNSTSNILWPQWPQKRPFQTFWK